MNRGMRVDAGLAVATALLAGLGTWWVAGPEHGDRPAGVLGLSLVAVASLALSFRRTAPATTFVAVAAATATYLALGNVYGPIIAVLMLAMLNAAYYSSTRQTVVLAVLGFALVATPVLVSTRGVGLGAMVPVAAWVVVPASLGAALRFRSQAEERGRSEMLRHSVDEERLRVAQEVHDIVGHGLTAIQMQADVALHLGPKKPEQAQVALELISRTSSEALEELRVALAPVGRTGGTDVPFTPVPGLTQLDSLVGRMSRAGLRVTVRQTGHRDERDRPAVDFVAYRIVQESLTNVLRYGSEHRAVVEIDWGADELVIDVSNPVRSVAPSGEGAGVAGMRRRAASLGGTVSAGFDQGPTFRVHARLPRRDPR